VVPDGRQRMEDEADLNVTRDSARVRDIAAILSTAAFLR
jgi:hypothetical protein